MSDITLPDNWDNISPEDISRTIHYLKEYCYHSDRDLNERWKFLRKRAEQRFSGGSGGICGYKEYKRIMKYIAPNCMGIKYGYVGATVCFIRMHSFNDSDSFSDKIINKPIDDILISIKKYQDNWYQNKTIANGELMWRMDGDYHSLFERMKKAYHESNAAPQICTVLQVMYAMQWNESQIKAIQSYLDRDDL